MHLGFDLRPMGELEENTKVPNNDCELQRVATDERKTIDLCGHERPGARCVRERGHEGQHECPVWTHVEPLRWD